MNEQNENRESEISRLREENERLRQALVAAETRKGVRLDDTLDWEEERRKADALLEPLRGGALGRRLALSASVHAGVILVASLGFLFLCIKYGSLEPGKAAAAAQKEAVGTEAAVDVPATPTVDEAPVPAAGSTETASDGKTNAARERMEQSLQESSSERPAESKVDLFGSEIDVDL